MQASQEGGTGFFSFRKCEVYRNRAQHRSHLRTERIQSVLPHGTDPPESGNNSFNPKHISNPVPNGGATTRARLSKCRSSTRSMRTARDRRQVRRVRLHGPCPCALLLRLACWPGAALPRRGNPRAPQGSLQAPQSTSGCSRPVRPQAGSSRRRVCVLQQHGSDADYPARTRVDVMKLVSRRPIPYTACGR